MKTQKNTKSIEDRILSCVHRKGEGWVFSPVSFLPFGSPEAIRKSLSRLEEKGIIRRLAWGLYDYPRQHKVLGTLPPSIDAIAKAIAKRDKINLQPSGALAANLIGLSDQVPAKIVYLSDGNAKKITVGKTELIFKNATPKIMASAGTPTGLLIQSLRYLGKDHLTDNVAARLKIYLKKWKRTEFVRFYSLAPAWMSKYIHQLVGVPNG